jgi:hypothetical protein
MKPASIARAGRETARLSLGEEVRDSRRAFTRRLSVFQSSVPGDYSYKKMPGLAPVLILER